MPEKPGPPRPGGRYSRSSITELPIPDSDPQSLRGVEKDKPANSAPPPVNYPTTRAEREAAELRAELAARESELEQIRQDAFMTRRRPPRRPPPLVDHVEVEPTSQRAKTDVIGHILRKLGVPSSLSGIAALAVYAAFFKQTAKPEQVEQVRTDSAKADVEISKRESAWRVYEQQYRTVLECRLNQLAVIARRAGTYELDWRNDGNVIFEATQVYRDEKGYMVEKGPFTLADRTKCPPLPKPPDARGTDP